MADLMASLHNIATNENIAAVEPGDTVRVHTLIVEGEKERVQVFQGVVIRVREGGINSSFTVRRIAAHGVGVERTFLFASPRIDKVEILRRAKVRRARLYYLRGRTGKAARMRERHARPVRLARLQSARGTLAVVASTQVIQAQGIFPAPSFVSGSGVAEPQATAMTLQDPATPPSPRVFPDLSRESALWAAGYRVVAGIDEVGRGALAGPVVAAAVVLPPDPAALARLLGQVDDFKRLTAAQRVQLDGAVRACALATGVGSVPAEEIDRIGIVPSTRLAMALALDDLSPRLSPDYLLIDFLTLPARPGPQLGLTHGDALSLSIAAASIVAKVARDAWMAAQDDVFGGYGFAAHKGYGTAAHQAALARLGPCPLHRRSFEPLKGLSAGTAPDPDSSDPSTPSDLSDPCDLSVRSNLSDPAQAAEPC